jgi:hypothetical protein
MVWLQIPDLNHWIVPVLPVFQTVAAPGTLTVYEQLPGTTALSAAGADPTGATAMTKSTLTIRQPLTFMVSPRH